MKTTVYALALLLLLASLVTTKSVATVRSGPSATGGGTFVLGDNVKRHFNFNAITHTNGSVTGHISLSDPTGFPNQDVDGTGEPGLEGSSSGFDVKADVDCVDVNGNRAALSGIITDATPSSYIGRRMILTVVDNGEGKKADGPDMITWGVYLRRFQRLVGDFENPDAGEFPVGVKNLVGDFENPDAGEFLVGDDDLGCRSFPLSSYSPVEISGGNIQVRP
ncbi:MAG: hypothetical protein H7Z38_22690 [Rubrivivax sp.]|nr:hypothetical protein [Pyrinomonadaceae bacterium]